MSTDAPRIVIVADNASLQMGGEASRPYFCFKLMRARGNEVWLVCHARVRDELRELFSEEDFARIHFLGNSYWQRGLWFVAKWLPSNVRESVFGQLINNNTKRRAKRVVRKLIAKLNLQAIYEPYPNAPMSVSYMYDLGVPVIIGPMSGGIELPKAFRSLNSLASRSIVSAVRAFAAISHRFVPGKLQADALIVANKRTELELPKGCRGKIYSVIESGVDHSTWQSSNRIAQHDDVIRFASSGRFVTWKGFQYLLEAFATAASHANVKLEIIGDGDMRTILESKAIALGLQDRVRFHGWLTRAESAQVIANCDAYVQPSLYEAGGTAILEAMALGLPIIATDWGGPSEIVNDSCGILVEPSSREHFVSGLGKAMLKLTQDDAARRRMGQAAKKRTSEHYFGWGSKVNRISEIIEETVSNAS